MPRLLFATNGGFFPESAGGTELATLEMLRGFVKSGWEVCLLHSTLPPHQKNPDSQKIFIFVQKHLYQFQSRLQSRTSKLDFDFTESLGFPSWKGPSWHSDFPQFFSKLLKEFKPDFFLTIDTAGEFDNFNLIELANMSHIPLAVYVHCALWMGTEALIKVPTEAPLIANSNFTARELKKRGGNVIGTIAPIFENFSNFRCAARFPKFITFINPVRQKGIDIALAVAEKMPTENFLFVKGKWNGLSYGQNNPYIEKIQKLPNATLWDFQYDIRKVWEVTELLLLPSQFKETFGRTIFEAQLNGIPAIARATGATADTLGAGGVLMEEKAVADDYVKVIANLKKNPDEIKKLSHSARLNSQNAKFDPQVQIDSMIELISNHVARNLRGG